MKIDYKTLRERAWAIAALSGVLVLHQDFPSPRFIDVSKLTWRGRDCVDVFATYGLCNVSGQVTDALELIVTLARDGSVRIAPADPAAEAGREALIAFLAGEISREAARKSEDFEAWLAGIPVAPDRTELLSLVAGAIAHRNGATDIRVEKDAPHRGICKIRLVGEFVAIELTAAGRYGVNSYTKGSGPYSGVLRINQEPDLRRSLASGQSAYSRLWRTTSFRVLQMLTLPLHAVLDARPRAEPAFGASETVASNREHMLT